MTFRRGLALTVLMVLALDAGLLSTGAHRNGGGMRERLSSTLETHAAAVSTLQDQTDDARAAIYKVMNSLDELADLCRRSDDIPEAHARWIAVEKEMESAQSAMKRLPSLTDKTIRESQKGRSVYSALEPSIVREEESAYLSALDQALGLVVETHLIYSEMNQALKGGFELYVELFARTRDFLEKQRSSFFRNSREASDWFTVRVEQDSLSGRIAAFKGALAALDVRASREAEKALAQYREVERLAARL